MIGRVLMTADAVGGVWSYALELARQFATRGVETVVAVMGPAPKFAPPAIDFHHRPCKLEWMEDPWQDVDQAGAWLQQIEQEIQPDVIHLNGYAHGAFPFRAPKVVVAHSCVLSWWQAVHGCAAPSCWDEYRGRVTRGLNGADLVIAPTRAMRNELARHYGTSAARVIPNGLSPGRFRPAAKENLVLTAGRLWDQAKNIALLDRIAPSLAWSVFAAGGGGSFANLKNLGELAPDAMAEWYSRAAIYALPARYEPFGLTPLEAAFSGCALVLGDIASLRENWRGAALFAPPDGDADFRDRLTELVRSATLRGAMQKAARARASAFRATTMADAYLAAYDDARRHAAATFKSVTNA